MSLYAKHKYAKTTINIRREPNIESRILGCVYWNDPVKIIKKVNRKWYKIQYKRKIGYLSAKYLKSKKSDSTVFTCPNSGSFKSYEDADCITNSNSLAQGKLKNYYHLDYNAGIWMIGNRYCIAVGSYYTKDIGSKIDLVLSYKGKQHILKCILADSKSDNDTINKHRIHKDGSIVEFVVKTRYLSRRTKITGDISCAGNKFKGKIVKIRVYK